MTNPSFAELFEASYSPEKFKQGSIIKATVIGINGEDAVMDAGMKSEAHIPMSQFRDLNGEINLEIGDEIEVYVDVIVDGSGETRLSREKAQRTETWNRLETAMNAGEIITGLVTSRVKGGLSLDIGKVRAFLPRSLIDVRQVMDMAVFEGETVQVKIVKLDAERSNLVVSRRAVIEEENRVERETLLSNLNEGDVVEGIVKNLTDYGAFIDMGGTDGLLHIADMAWKRVNHPSEILTIGDKIEVQVLKFDRERYRVSLGMKQLTEDPWENIQERYAEGSIVEGAKVANLTDYGAFVALGDAIDGLVHSSELDWTNGNVHPRKVLHIGQEVSVKVLEVDTERRRISLSIKQTTENPWEIFSHTHNRGDKVRAEVRSITDFGLFVGLPGGIDGLVHITDLTWEENSEEVLRGYQKAQEVEAVVLSIDTDRERISLGIKQLTTDTFMQFASGHSRGSLVEGTVTEILDDEVVVSLGDNINGSLRKQDVLGELSIGSKVQAAVANVDRKNRKLLISMKNLEMLQEKEALKQYRVDNRREEQEMNSTLGTLFENLEEQSDDK